MAQTEGLLSVIREEIQFNLRKGGEERLAEKLVFLYKSGTREEQALIEEIFEVLTGWSFEFLLFMTKQSKAGVQ